MCTHFVCFFERHPESQCYTFASTTYTCVAIFWIHKVTSVWLVYLFTRRQQIQTHIVIINLLIIALTKYKICHFRIITPSVYAHTIYVQICPHGCLNVSIELPQQRRQFGIIVHLCPECVFQNSIHNMPTFINMFSQNRHRSMMCLPEIHYIYIYNLYLYRAPMLLWLKSICSPDTTYS